MSFEEFERSVAAEAVAPAGLSLALQALWAEARGDWDGAHALAQQAETGDGAWVHAYLHRKEGDESNAGYWYAQARRPHARGDLRAEWEQIARALLCEA